jgi:hypothetical protein
LLYSIVRRHTKQTEAKLIIQDASQTGGIMGGRAHQITRIEPRNITAYGEFDTATVPIDQRTEKSQLSSDKSPIDDIGPALITDEKHIDEIGPALITDENHIDEIGPAILGGTEIINAGPYNYRDGVIDNIAKPATVTDEFVITPQASAPNTKATEALQNRLQLFRDAI